MRARARRAYEIARLSTSWPLLVAAVAFGLLGVVLGAPARLSICVAAVLIGFCAVSQWWRTTAGSGCACGLVGGGAGLLVLGTARLCGMGSVVTARGEVLPPACILAALLAVAATAAVRPRHWSYWPAAVVAFSLVLLLVANAAGCA